LRGSSRLLRKPASSVTQCAHILLLRAGKFFFPKSKFSPESQMSHFYIQAIHMVLGNVVTAACVACSTQIGLQTVGTQTVGPWGLKMTTPVGPRGYIVRGPTVCCKKWTLEPWTVGVKGLNCCGPNCLLQKVDIWAPGYVCY